jgi:F-type H+-transporting ATPase subunit gamma
LCGGYNGNVLRMAHGVLKQLEEAGVTPELHVSGKKGIAYFRFAKREAAQTYATLGDNPKYAEIEPLANAFIQKYIDGDIDALKVVYMRFLSVGQQKAGVMDILPLAGLAGVEAQGSAKPAPAVPAPKATTIYDFSPSPAEILDELIPITIKVSLFQTFIEAAVSEQIARMVAMKAATDNADKMVKKLTQEYNRARQSQITGELSELMGGVEAMK